MFGRILIANRGEIALRILRTARRMGIETVAIHSDADRFTPAPMEADRAIRIGPDAPAESYLKIDAIIAACRASGAEAVHPGYGFLSENIAFAKALAEAGIAFIGPRPAHLEAFALKHVARELARKAGVPLLPGSGIVETIDQARAEAARIGYPVMLKSTAGGGGIGMQLCTDEAALATRLETVRRQGGASFGDARVYLEKFVADARHVEVQIFGDGRGGVVTLGERDCSLQRRNQKVIEETPAPNLPARVRAELIEAARRLAQSVDYASAGTVEFVYDAAEECFYFLEVNTRLQVEHPVTEAVYGVDLVEWMIREAVGDFVLPAQASLVPRGAAIEARIYAEDPARGYRPSTGLITELRFPEEIRVDGWIETGTEVTANYDPLLAKLIVHGDDRDDALTRLAGALDRSAISGIETNLDLLRAVAASEQFRAGRALTRSLADLHHHPRTVEVLAPGAQSSLQDWPGRVGYWQVGVPPGGPMDDRSFRLANRILGNPEGAPALECTFAGPTLRFDTATIIALMGARMTATLDGVAVPFGHPVAVAAGQVLSLGLIEGPGQRTYLAVRNGFDAPDYLGSRSTFTLGQFGGHATGALKTGDVLRIAASGAGGEPMALPAEAWPALTREWTLDVVYGPHGAPDFFAESDIETLFAARYEVHFNSARTGVRLLGPKPAWARGDGGEAGLHPSNIHDVPYAIGSINFTGDMPILLGPDGPSLGGFVCAGVVAVDERWKLGQLKPGDGVRFRPRGIAAPSVIRAAELPSPIRARIDDQPIPAVYRAAGDDYLLVEYGPMALDLRLRLRVHSLMQALEATGLPGIIDLTPGIRSLQIHVDPTIMPLERLIDALTSLERNLPGEDEVEVASRIVHLPLAWDDAQTRLAMRKYQELVRPDAPWCPSNIEFIRRINGLASVEEVRRTVFDASYMVLGLGDVYLGAPAATPLDPRHRLVTTKYNPARTWTPQNAVGIGGAYLCIYGMESPGGYQLFGRTIQIWNAWRTTREFERGKPWLLRFFDQIRFFPVSDGELEEARAAFPHGRYPITIEETRFSWREQAAFLAEHAESIREFTRHRQAAFEAERRMWEERGLAAYVAEDPGAPAPGEDEVPAGAMRIDAPSAGSVWKILAEPGARIEAGQVVAILESMKMEMEVRAPAGGTLLALRCQPGRTVRAGQALALLEVA